MSSFHEIIGHTRAIEILQSYLRRNEIPHALLFMGEEGIGKETVELGRSIDTPTTSGRFAQSADLLHQFEKLRAVLTHQCIPQLVAETANVRPERLVRVVCHGGRVLAGRRGRATTARKRSSSRGWGVLPVRHASRPSAHRRPPALGSLLEPGGALSAHRPRSGRRT